MTIMGPMRESSYYQYKYCMIEPQVDLQWNVIFSNFKKTTRSFAHMEELGGRGDERKHI